MKNDPTRASEIYNNEFLRIEQSSFGDLFLKTKDFRPFAFCLAMIIRILFIFAFGAWFVLASHQFAEGKAHWKLAFVGLPPGVFGMGIGFWAIRQAWWGCFPKTFTVDRKTRLCLLRTYLFIRRTIPLDELEAIGLKCGASGNFGYWGCLYLFKSRGIKRLRLCIPSCGGSRHETLKVGMEVAKILSIALKVPLVSYNKRKERKWTTVLSPE